MSIIIALGALSVVAIVAAVYNLFIDGYHRIPTRH